VSSFMTAEGDPQWALFDRRGSTLRALSVQDGRLSPEKSLCFDIIHRLFRWLGVKCFVEWPPELEKSANFSRSHGLQTNRIPLPC
jgi:hypothetical protein